MKKENLKNYDQLKHLSSHILTHNLFNSLCVYHNELHNRGDTRYQGNLLKELCLGDDNNKSYVDAYFLPTFSNGVSMAYEIKATRQDFLNDVKNPIKQKLAKKHSHLFFYVCYDGMIEPNEVPEGVGLVYIKMDIIDGNCEVDYKIIKHPIRTKPEDYISIQNSSPNSAARVLNAYKRRIEKIGYLPIGNSETKIIN